MAKKLIAVLRHCESGSPAGRQRASATGRIGKKMLLASAHVSLWVAGAPCGDCASPQGELMRVIYHLAEESAILDSFVNGYDWPLFMTALSVPDREGQEWAARANFRLVKVYRASGTGPVSV